MPIPLYFGIQCIKLAKQDGNHKRKKNNEAQGKYFNLFLIKQNLDNTADITKQGHLLRSSLMVLTSFIAFMPWEIFRATIQAQGLFWCFLLVSVSQALLIFIPRCLLRNRLVLQNMLS